MIIPDDENVMLESLRPTQASSRPGAGKERLNLSPASLEGTPDPLRGQKQRKQDMSETETKATPPVVPIASVKNLTADRDKVLVEKLESFVELAKEGHLSDIAIIGKVRGESMTEFEWESDSPLELLGALELAKQEISSDILAEADPEDEDED